MKGDRVEALVDTGGGVQTFEILATKAGRRIEVTTARGVVEVAEVTRSGKSQVAIEHDHLPPSRCPVRPRSFGRSADSSQASTRCSGIR